MDTLCNLLRFLVCLIFVLKCRGQACAKSGPCKCEMADDSGTINLNSLASSNDGPRWTLEGADGFIYSYNPCVGFQKSNLNVSVYRESVVGGANSDLGMQNTEGFEYSVAKGNSLTYASGDGLRSSVVTLICSRFEENELRFIGEVTGEKFSFILISRCACVGVCDDNGVIVPTEPPTMEPEEMSTPQYMTTPQEEEEEEVEEVQGEPVFVWWRTLSDLVTLAIHDVLLILVIGCCIMLFRVCTLCWKKCRKEKEEPACDSNRVFIPRLNTGRI